MNRRPAPCRRLRRLPVWLFAVALVLQVAMPFSQVLATAAAGDSGSFVEICTASGQTAVYLDADGNAADPPPAPLPVACEFCHLCQSVGTPGSGLAGKPLLLDAPKTRTATIPAAIIHGPCLPHLLSPRLARGPPALI